MNDMHMRKQSSPLVFGCILIVILLLLSGCGLPPDEVRVSSGRQVLASADLLNGFEPKGLVDYVHLARPERAAAPLHVFEGRLELLGEETNGSVSYLSGAEGVTAATGHLPEFDFEFFQSGDYIVPVQRGLIITGHPDWDYILEPGRAWTEPGDDGWTRASLPFFLVVKGGNSNLAGVFTFLFNGNGVSKVYYQISQEITISFRADFWGVLDAVYTPSPVTGAAMLQAAFDAEVSGRMATHPVEQLAEEYPGLDIQAFIRNISPPDLTTWGLVVDGIHYRGGCTTRSGEYPYCEAVRMPSFSTAKTAFVSVALMRLEEEYGPGVSELLIRDFLPETVASPGDWSTVTFNDTLDMATGNFATSSYMVDEEGRIFNEFFNVLTYDKKIASALDWPRGAPPGTTWVYRSSDTFILVAAMQNFLEEKQGPQADIFQYVVNEVYRPLGLGPGFFSTSRTADDNWQGLPIGATGLWWIPDDIARLGDFLNNSGGALDGVQLLDPILLAAALQRDPADCGVLIPGGMYNNAFWSQSFGPAQGFDCTFSVPYMAGYSGNIIALMPSGVTFYYFSDQRDFNWTSAVLAADTIHPFCQP
jgi:CubicO group peptidase (beta-lactamase class C family)